MPLVDTILGAYAKHGDRLFRVRYGGIVFSVQAPEYHGGCRFIYEVADAEFQKPPIPPKDISLVGLQMEVECPTIVKGHLPLSACKQLLRYREALRPPSVQCFMMPRDPVQPELAEGVDVTLTVFEDSDLIEHIAILEWAKANGIWYAGPRHGSDRFFVSLAKCAKYGWCDMEKVFPHGVHGKICIAELPRRWYSHIYDHVPRCRTLYFD